MKKRAAVVVACETKDTLPLYALTEFQGSLKKIEPEDLAKLKNEILRTGFAFPVYVWKDVKAKKNYIVGGHQRVKALAALKDDGIKVPDVPVVYVKAKDHRAAKRRVLQDVAQYGRLDGAGLHSFMVDNDFGLDELVGDFRLPDLNLSNFEMEFFPNSTVVREHERLLHGEGDEELENTNPFSQKVEIPIYEPKEAEPPPIPDLFDDTKTKELIAAIEKSKIPDDVKSFLKIAAYRHTVFRFDRIAEFYAHAPKHVQNLMEQSALVIIDFKKAIENGFMALSDDFVEAYKNG